MSFPQNREVSFNQESLPITYHNFRHQSLVRPKSKSPNWQESQKDKIHSEDHKHDITYQNILGKTKVRPLFTP